MRKRLGIECCLLSGACTFSEEKVFLSGCSVAPEPLAFRNEELEGLFRVQFWLTSFGFIGGLKRFFSYFALGREAQACFQPFCFLFRVLAFNYPHRQAQACFQLFCSRPVRSGIISAILLFVSGVSLLATLIGGLKHLFSSFALDRYVYWKQLGESHNKTCIVEKNHLY